MGNQEIILHNGQYETSVFPGGEVHVRVTKIKDRGLVTANLRSSESIMRLLLLADALKRLSKPITFLSISYLPYARQDRVCNPGEALSAYVMAQLINSIGADTVSVLDPHSDVLPALLNNCEVCHIDSLKLGTLIGDQTLICPDAGAEKRIQKLKRPYIMATKVRNPKTGEITVTQVHADDLTGKNCLIIDDICDGGRTFIELAKVLRAKGATSVNLYVTHGIFSKGFDVFKGHINRVFWIENYIIKEQEICA
jgi:ribose-phosphate pyrophosphokinase